jgi:hypothetical protein
MRSEWGSKGVWEGEGGFQYDAGLERKLTGPTPCCRCHCQPHPTPRLQHPCGPEHAGCTRAGTAARCCRRRGFAYGTRQPQKQMQKETVSLRACSVDMGGTLTHPPPTPNAHAHARTRTLGKAHTQAHSPPMAAQHIVPVSSRGQGLGNHLGILRHSQHLGCGTRIAVCNGSETKHKRGWSTYTASLIEGV